MQSEEKLYTTIVEKGISNFERVELKIGEHYSVQDFESSVNEEEEKEDTFDYCEVKVDGTECNSCSFCAQEDYGSFAVDCSNVVSGAITTCDSIQDYLYGIISKLATVEEGWTRSPTQNPTRPSTRSPASRPESARRQTQ